MELSNLTTDMRRVLKAAHAIAPNGEEFAVDSLDLPGMTERERAVGGGWFQGVQHAFLLTPVPEVSTATAATLLAPLILLRRSSKS